MNYFKDENNKVYGYTDTQVKRGYGDDLTAITEDEKDKLQAPTEEQLLKQKKQETYSRLAEIDKEAVRPTRAIKVAELQGKEPNQFDVNKLIKLENEADTLREKLKGL